MATCEGIQMSVLPFVFSLEILRPSILCCMSFTAPSPSSSRTVVKCISPMLAAADMGETLKFYVEILGFTIEMESPEYSVIGRDGATVHFMKAAEGVMAAVSGHVEIYVQVSGVHALWDQVRPLKGQYRIKDLCERDYGMTEFIIADPNNILVYVGEPTDEVKARQAKE